MLVGENKKPCPSCGSAANPKPLMSITLSALVAHFCTHPGRRYTRHVYKSPFLSQYGYRVWYFVPLLRGAWPSWSTAKGRWGGGPCTTRRAIQTRPLPTEVNEEFITVIAVTENRAKPARLAQFSARRREKEATTERTRPFRVRGFYSCSFALHHDCDLVVLTCTL